MSPAFVNRFDEIVIEKQLEKLNDNDLGELISNIYFNSFDRIPKKEIRIEENNIQREE